ncbi:enolase 4 [Sinocyclocheilus anshuiensis]|uniref:enolase 4 n=1 Tax=Sinocyclocheilus anshuiensis TaxID=1608454 RepID=UPI0007B7B46E|nr:PREDICTED: enolase 4 [Sinocyclocheilus anshuiensis]
MSYKAFLNHSKVSKEDQEFYDLKNKAAEYYRSNGVPQKIENVLNEMFWQKPDDIYGYLANYFSRLSYTPVISKIVGREVFDGRGLTAVQTQVYCIIRNEEKVVCSAVMSGPSDGLEADGVAESGEAFSNSNQQRLSITAALKWIREHLGPMLQDFNPTDQTNVDKLLSDFFMARYLEHKDSLNIEKEDELRIESVSEAPPQATPTPAPTKDKKGSDKGKKGNSTEKPLPPAETPVPQLPGATAVGVVSLAVAKTAARLLGEPLYRHITSVRVPQAQSEVHLPVPMITILSCGKNSAGKLNLLEEVILMPSSSQRGREVIGMGFELQCEMKRVLNGSAYKAGPIGVTEEGALQVGFERPEQALDLVTEACANLALPLGSDLRLAINCATHGLMDYSCGKYEVMSGCHKSPDELVDMYEGLINKYPAITSLIDPFRKEDVDQWERLASVIGQSCCLIADAASNLCPCWSEVKPLPPGVTRVIIRHHSDMTISDLIKSIAEQKDAETILAAGSGDKSIVDLAVGSGVSFLKLGGLRGGERMDKYNRLLAIEEELEQEGILGAREKKQPLSDLSETLNSGSGCDSVTIST